MNQRVYIRFRAILAKLLSIAMFFLITLMTATTAPVPCCDPYFLVAGGCYRLVGLNVEFSTAQKMCSVERGHLAIFESRDEWNAVRDRVTKDLCAGEAIIKHHITLLIFSDIPVAVFKSRHTAYSAASLVPGGAPYHDRLVRIPSVQDTRQLCIS